MTASEALYSTPRMAALFSDEAHIARMLAFEAALARAEAACGVIPAHAAGAIADACQMELFDVPSLFRDAASAGTVPIPLVQRLTALVVEEARGYVHWGATSQDAIDTALMLQMRDGLDLLLDGLRELGDASALLAERHRHTTMAGRTLLQQALPITFGLKAARWTALVARQTAALRSVRSAALALQFGGAAGTLASLGEDGPRVQDALARQLGLSSPPLPWHAERDRVGTIASALGVLAGSVSKIAEDIALLAQSEVGETSEAVAPGKGGSSTLPQKRNPVDATLALAAGRLALGCVPVLLTAMAQEHERGVGGWQAEWSALPDLFRYTAGALAHTSAAVAGLNVDAERMRANLDATYGLIMAEALTTALAPALGRHVAQRLVQQVCRSALENGVSLRDAAEAEPSILEHLSAAALTRTLDPAHYLGSTDIFIDRALDQWREARGAVNAGRSS
jgi:3-carboxy-cis,cis-muconate cycloisomerase